MIVDIIQDAVLLLVIVLLVWHILTGDKHTHPEMEDYKVNLRSCPWCHAPLHYRAPIAIAHLQWCHGRECAHFGTEHGGWAKPHEKKECQTLRAALNAYGAFNGDEE